MSERRWFVVVLLIATSWMPGHVERIPAQQIPDPNFDATVAHPAYTASHPRVAIDEAHKNIHTAGGLFKPFADLARNDGYDVVANTAKFTRDSLQGYDVLVISNAVGELENDDNHSTPAFTHPECDAVYEWVGKGGALFLIADHGPMGDAAAPLAQRFGVTLGNGFVSDSNPSNFTDNDPTELVFSAQNLLLGEHPITRGRDQSEQLHRLVAFKGESVTIPRGATAILSLSRTTGEVPTRGAAQLLFVDDVAKAQANRESAATKWPVGDRAMAIAFLLGRGRVVISGEAGMITAQVFKKRDKNGTEALVGKMGMDVQGNDDRQYVLNALHWLSGVLK
ncbi:MAG TPA: hypothetical protein VGP19_11525 [Candidatus Acidoferrales bacterium]|jgi:hypothetical protein|nr:hypothetical protein [Candidatus Acidoferrales bacterium]